MPRWARPEFNELVYEVFAPERTRNRPYIRAVARNAELTAEQILTRREQASIEALKAAYAADGSFEWTPERFAGLAARLNVATRVLGAMCGIFEARDLRRLLDRPRLPPWLGRQCNIIYKHHVATTQVGIRNMHKEASDDRSKSTR